MMSSSVSLHTQLASVMESLVHAAVAELKKVEDWLEVRTGGTEGTESGSGEETDSREKMVRSGVAGPGLWTWTMDLVPGPWTWSISTSNPQRQKH